MKKMRYSNLALMFGLSFVIMYLVMFLNMDSIEHYHTSAFRIYMALMMVAPMAVMMMSMMGSMYPDKRVNAAIVVGGIALLIAALAALRTQSGVGDIQYM